MNIFVWKLSKIAAQKKVFFFTFFGLLRFSLFFNGLFAPTSQSRMSNIFRDSKSLGKSIGKKWSNIWTFLFGSGLKSPRKKFFFLLILPWSTLLWHRCYYPHRSRDALSPVCGIFLLAPSLTPILLASTRWQESVKVDFEFSNLMGFLGPSIPPPHQKKT